MRKAFFILLLLPALCLNLYGCNEREYLRPTREFYVNDYAEVLLPATCASIVAEGERLYEVTQDEEEGGAQLVVATFLVEEEEDIASYDKTELFREWRIGKNDMGFLILMFFQDLSDGEDTGRFLIDIQIELGYRMEQYFNANELNTLIDTCLYNPEWEGNLDRGLAELIYEILSVIYIEAYGYESFDFDMQEYSDYLNSYQGESYQAIPMTFLYYLLSPYSSLATKLFIILPFSVIFLLGGGRILLRRNRGGGGSSGGYGV